MKRIVVTGATSMIGTALIEVCLRQGLQVAAVVRRDSAKLGRLPRHENLQIVDCELENLQRLPEHLAGDWDTFYHMAWAYTGASRNRSTLLQSKNITYTLEALQAARSLGCRRFIGAGSQAEYGALNLETIGPETPEHPDTPYGAAKLAAGKLAFLLAEELGMECIWPRIFSVYGIYDKESSMISSALAKMLRGEETAFTPAEQRWDYLFSEDAGRAFYLIGERGRDRSVYCVGSGKARPLREYIEAMGRAAGLRQVNGIGSLPYPPRAVMNLCADIKNLQQDTGFMPTHSFEAGIQKTTEWLRRAL